MKRKTLGIAIGAGAARGLSAIGILKVFEKHNIPIDYIAGTSIGSVIGSLYAYGYKADDIERILVKTKWENYLDFTFPENGFMSGNKLEDFLKEKLKNKKFRQLKIPLAVVATDINKGNRVIFTKGDVATAVRASFSLPGFFTPVIMDKMILVDGGITDPIPTDIVRKKCDIVVAADFSVDIKHMHYTKSKKQKDKFTEMVKQNFINDEIGLLKSYAKEKNLKLPVALRILLYKPHYFVNMILNRDVQWHSNIMAITAKSEHTVMNELAKTKMELYKPDILIKPCLNRMGGFEFDKGRYCIKQGEIEALKHIKTIKSKLNAK